MPAFRQALFQQALLYVLTGRILDHFATNHVATVAIFAHWAAMVMVVIRRPTTPLPLTFGFAEMASCQSSWHLCY